MTPVKVRKTAPHPFVTGQTIVLVPQNEVSSRMPRGSEKSLCDKCALDKHCTSEDNPKPGYVRTLSPDPYACGQGVWITIEEYVEWHQQKEEGTS